MSGVNQADVDKVSNAMSGVEGKQSGKFNDESGGNHEYEIVSALIEKSQKNETMIVYTLKVLDEEVGNTVRKYAMLTKDCEPDTEKMEYAKGDLMNIGFEVNAENSLESVLAQLPGIRLNGFAKVGKDDFVNRYFNERIYGDSEPKPETEKKDKDTVPF